MVIACALVLCAGTAQARLSPQQTAQLTCERQKLNAQGALEKCLKQNSANILAGIPDGSATCQSEFTQALALADTAAARAGTSCRYLDNGDGTVSDLNTGLMWEQKTGTVGTPNPSDVHNVNNTYSWCINDSDNCDTASDLPDGTAFTTFLYGVNGGTSSDGTSTSGCFANHCDWRLPLIEELAGILDFGAPGCGYPTYTGPCIDPTFPGPTQAAGYWSATTYAPPPVSDEEDAWGVEFGGGGGGREPFL